MFQERCIGYSQRVIIDGAHHTLNHQPCTLNREQERYTDYSQKVIIKASVQSSDMQWRHICFSLSREESRWLIDDVGRAAL